MQLDPEYLRQHYASLTDEALRAIDKTELVEIARRCYDEELARRESTPDDSGGSPPDWSEEAVCVCSFDTAQDAGNARDVLQAAEIPCYVDVNESAARQANDEYRLMVPGRLNLQAASVLDKEIFNAGIEAGYRTHFEMLSDEELSAVDPQSLTAGLLDRIERLTKAYEEELSRRQLEAESFKRDTI